MHEIVIVDELALDIYNRLIEYACAKSDAFMLVIYRYDKKIQSTALEIKGKFAKSKEIQASICRANEEAQKRRLRDRKIFKESAKPFLKKLDPYMIKKRNFPTEWPGTQVIFYDNNTDVDICVYKMCEEVKKFLLEPKGIFKWKYPYFPEDLCFFKDGECWLETTAHDEFGIIYTNDFEDIETLKNIGVNFDYTERNEKEIDLFHEDYNL